MLEISFSGIPCLCMRYSAAQVQLDTHEQRTRAVWDFYPRSQVPPAQTHATGYLLQLINTIRKRLYHP